MFANKVIAAISELRQYATPVDLTSEARLAANLLFVYQVIVASERLLAEAAEDATGELKRYYLSHLEEERNHAEWLAEDLSAIGVDVSSVAPLVESTELAGVQYYLIKHVNAASLLGYMAVLEGFPFPVEDVELLERVHGKKALRTLRYHAIHDQEHRKQLFETIDKVADQEILRNAIQTQMYVNRVSHSLASIGENKND